MGAFVPPPGQPKPLAPGEFAGVSVPNVVTFGFRGIGPPSPLYISRDDQLFVQAGDFQPLGTQTVTFTARLLLPVAAPLGQPDAGVSVSPAPPVQGANIVTIVTQIAATQSGMSAAQAVPLAEGYLLSLTAANSGAAQRGQIFVRAWISRGAPAYQSLNAATMLLADYCTSTAAVGWPNARVLYPTEGPGNLRSITVANPAAGADWSLLQGVNRRWRVQSWAAQLVTSATAGNRIVRARVLDPGGSIIWQAAAQQTLAPSLTAVVSATTGQVTSTIDTLSLNVPLPGALFLSNQCTLSVNTTALSATDQWSAIRVYVEEWGDLV